MTKHLESLYVKNFRCLDELTIEKLGDVNLLVGGNNSGKTTVLEALRIFASKGGWGSFNGGIREIIIAHRETAISPELTRDIVQKLFTNREFPKNDSEKIEIGTIEDRLYINELFYKIENTNNADNVGGTKVKITKSEIGKIIEEKRPDLLANIWPSIELIYRGQDAILGNKYSDEWFVPPHFTYINHGFASTGLIYYSSIYDLLNYVIENGDDDKCLMALNILDETITRVNYTAKDDYTNSHLNNNKPNKVERILIKKKNDKTPIALQSMGEGMERILRIALHAATAKDGILLIDEIENGLHYSMQIKVWNWLFELSKLYNMQIFATTHSWDIIKNFNEVAQQREEEGTLISLGRTKSGNLVSHPYSEEALNVYVTSGMEVR